MHYAALLAAPKQYLSLDVEHDPGYSRKERKINCHCPGHFPTASRVGASVDRHTWAGESYNLLDNGLGVDEKANDGIYSQSVFAPNLLSFDLVRSGKSQWLRGRE